METKKKEQNTKAEAETFAATVKGMNRDDQLMLNGFLLGLGAAKISDSSRAIAGFLFTTSRGFQAPFPRSPRTTAKAPGAKPPKQAMHYSKLAAAGPGEFRRNGKSWQAQGQKVLPEASPCTGRGRRVVFSDERQKKSGVALRFGTKAAQKRR